VKEEASSMYERFTERARKVVVLAQEEARSFGHAYIGTEHLLLGLIREDEGIAAQALGRLNVTVSGAREQLEAIVGRGEDRDFTQAPFTPRSKKVLELALRESMHLGHNYIGTEHVLLGLVREREGVANRMLSNLGVEADEVREQVVRMLGDEPPESRGRAAPRREVGPRESVRDPLVFRGQVESLRITARFEGHPHTLLVDLDYAYAVRDAEDASDVVNHGDLLAGVIGVLEAQELRSVEAGVLRVGEHVLERFPAIREVMVSATDQRTLEAHAVAGFKVIRTFRR
jgi:dihydroneopterin aldolase